jgi:hypothetical protein
LLLIRAAQTAQECGFFFPGNSQFRQSDFSCGKMLHTIKSVRSF